MKLFIVTGGAGFIGSNIVKGLNETGITDIVIVDNLQNSEKFRNLIGIKFTDFVDKTEVWKYLEGTSPNRIETIFHQGACTDTLEDDGKYMMSNNYDYSKKLLHFAIDNRIRFIYASSAAVYGKGEDGFRESEVCEKPLNIYGFSKFMFDRHVRISLLNTESQITGLRYFNVYGPNEAHKGKMASVILQFYKQIKNEGKLRLFEGSKNYKRDFIYVRDVVDVNLFFLNHPELSGIYNCGTGRAESFLKVAEIVKEFYPQASIEFISFPEDLKSRYQTFTRADISSLRNAGYTGKFTTIEEGIPLYIKDLEAKEV